MSTAKVRAALPGFNALTDTNLDHFSIYSDEDNILIKEKERGTINIASSAIGTVNHNLGYVPFCLPYVIRGSKLELITGAANNSTGSADASLGTGDLRLSNNGGSTTFKYFIFYDQATQL